MAGLRGQKAHANATSFAPGNKIHRSRAKSKNKELMDCLLEGVRLAEEDHDRAERRRIMQNEGKAAEEINAILAEMESMDREESLIHFWRRLAGMGTDSAMKIIAERLLPKAKLPAIFVAAKIDERTADKIAAMMVNGNLPPDVAQAMLSTMNGVKELKERDLQMKLVALQVEAIEKGLLDAEDDD